MSAEPQPTFTDAKPNITTDDHSIQFILTVNNTNGYIYYGIEITLNTNISVSVPSWSQFIEGMNINNQALVQYSSNPITMGNNFTINISNLTVGSTYNIYFGASNENYPRIYSSLYSELIIMNNRTSSSSYGRIINKFPIILLIIASFMIILA